MKWLKDNIIYIVLIFLNTILLMRTTEICYKIQNFSYAYITFLFLLGVTVFWIYNKIMYKLRYKIIFSFLLIIILCAIFLLRKNYIQDAFNILIVQNYLTTDNLIFNGVPTLFSQYQALLTLIIPISIAAVLSITSRGLTNIILVITATYMITFWYLGFQNDITKVIPIFLIISLITYSLGMYEKKIKKLSKAGINVFRDNRGLILNTIVFSMLIVLIGGLLPKQFLGKMDAELQNKVMSVFVPNMDSNLVQSKNQNGYSYTGFSRNTDKLGGAVFLNNSLAFKVKSDRPYYLIGSVKDYYTGDSWKETGRTFAKQTGNIPLNELSKKFLGKRTSIIIYPVSMNTSSFFVPELSYKVSTSEDNVFYDNIPTYIDKNNISSQYTVDFYESNLNDSLSNNLGNNESSEVYQNKYKQYLQLPYSITKQTKDLAYNITKGGKTNLEKVQKIKKYLQDNYKYSTDVPDVPANSEFVDYFLFKQKKGYCTYFATASTILCRIVGIPARYVEGFNMRDAKDSNGLYEVSNNNAHAWCEVLLMNSKNSGLWSVMDSVPKAEESAATSSSVVTAPESSDSIVDSQNETTPTPSVSEVSDTPTPTAVQSKEVSHAAKSNNSKTNNIQNKVLLFMFLVIFITLLIIFIRIFKFRIALRRILMNESVLPLYEYSKKRLRKININKPDNAGEIEFTSLLENESLRENMEKIANLSCGEFYGKKKHCHYDKYQFYNYIEMYIKSRQNIFKYYFNKYIL